MGDRLLNPNETPLFPKLIYGKYQTADLRRDDNGRFGAHLTLVIDFFSTALASRAYLASGGNTERLFAAQDGLCHGAASLFDWGDASNRYLAVQLELTEHQGKHLTGSHAPETVQVFAVGWISAAHPPSGRP